MFDQSEIRLFKQPLKGVVMWKTKSWEILSLLQILYTDLKFVRSVIQTNPSVDNFFAVHLRNVLNRSRRRVNKKILTWWYL